MVLQPGNGAKYFLLVSFLTDELNLCNRRVLTWINNRRAMEIPDHWGHHESPSESIVRLHAGYISQKMECAMADAEPIARCLLEEVL
jgi:hypothetical protein